MNVCVFLMLLCVFYNGAQLCRLSSVKINKQKSSINQQLIQLPTTYFSFFILVMALINSFSCFKMNSILNFMG